MKNISQKLKEHLSGSVLSIATCWKLTLTNGKTMGFSDCDKDLKIDNMIYEPSAGFTTSSIVNNSDLAIDNLEIEGILNSDNIKEEDVLAGKYDFAQIEIFLVNYNDLSQGSMNIHYGNLGKVTLNNGRFVVEVHGLSARLTQNIGELYSNFCRAQFCDSQCKLNSDEFTKVSTITSVISQQEFQDTNLTEDSDYYKYGVIKFITGANHGLIFAVKEYQKEKVMLFMPAPYKITEGDEYSVTGGCDKAFSTCRDKFNNAKNFRGEPNVPGIHSLYQTAGTL